VVFWKNKRVLVTGGGGFIGTNVLKLLERETPNDIINIRKKDYDLTKESEAVKCFKKYHPDILIHLAGKVGGLGINNEQPVEFFYNNILINTFTIESAFRCGVNKIVTTAAGCGYPEFASLPLSEKDFWNGFPQAESAPYSIAKRMLHIQSMAYWRQHKLPIIVCLPGNVYGPYDNFNLDTAHVGPALIRKFVEAIKYDNKSITVWGDGTPTRDFVYVDDVAFGILKAAENCKNPCLLNISTGTETSINQLVNILTKISKYEGEIVWDKTKVNGQSRRVFDISLAKKNIKYTPQTSIEKGFKKTFDWYSKKYFN